MRNVLAMVDPITGKDVDRATWLAARKQGVGSSDAPRIMGVSPWGGPFDVWAEKVSTDPPREEPNALMRLGQIMEDGVAQLYAERYGATIVKPGHMYAHDQHDWMLSNPDRFREDEGHGIVELKLGFSRDKYDDGLPEDYTIQVLHQMGVDDQAEYADVAVLMHGRDLLRYTVERDQATIDALMEVEAQFWQRVVNGDPPAPDHLSTDSIKRLFRKVSKGAEREVSPDLRDAVREYREARAAETAAKQRKEAAGNLLRAAVGDAEVGLIDGQPAYTWKESAPEGLDLDALEADHPDLVAAYRKPQPRRTLNIKKGFDA